MKTQFTYNRDDLYQAQLLNYSSTKTRRFLRTVGWLGALILILSLLISSMLPIAVMAAMFIALPLGYPYILKRHSYNVFKNSSSFNKEFTFDIQDEGIQVNTNTSNGSAKWETFSRYASDPNMLIIYPQTNIFYMIPKRVLSNEDWLRLLELVKSKIKGSK
jgi:hypothetical protein